MSWGKIHAGQQVQQNNQIASDIVYFHGAPVWVIQAEMGAPFK
jgi:hypothetical protein